MRRFALGVLSYDADRFGRMRVCDMLDAIVGYKNAEFEKIKNQAHIIRTATALLWNIQVDKGSRLKEDELWPLPWDKKVEPIPMSEEERQKIIEFQTKLLNGNCNNQP